MPAGRAFASFCTPLGYDDIVEQLVDTPQALGFETAAPEITEYRGGEKVALRYRGLDLDFHLERDANGVQDPVVHCALGNYLSPSTYAEAAGFREHMDIILELLARLATAFDAEYVPVYNTEERSTDVFPTGDPIGEHIDPFPELGIYSEAVLKQAGGAAALYDSPPWFVATLRDGRVLVIEREFPWTEADWSPPTDADYVADVRT